MISHLELMLFPKKKKKKLFQFQCKTDGRNYSSFPIEHGLTKYCKVLCQSYFFLTIVSDRHLLKTLVS